MKVIPPIAITDSLLTSSTVAEPTAPAAVWVSGTTYTVGTIRSVAGSIFREYVHIIGQTATLWVSGTTYIIGDLRNSVINGFTYKRITAGAGTTDPASDAINWTDLRTISPELNQDQWEDIGAYERVWISGTTYAADDVVIRTQTHRKYQRVVGGAGTSAPEMDTTSAAWLDIGPTNKWAMFALDRNTGTVGISPMVVSITPGQRITSLGLVGLEANSVTITQTIGATTYYSRTVTTLLRNTLTWTEYLTGAFRYQPSVVLFDIPPISGSTINITITGGACTCSGVVIGNYVDLGTALSQPTVGALNFSKITRDDYGGSILVPRRTVPKTSQKLLVDSHRINALMQVRKDLNAEPALWSGLDDMTTHDYFESLLILGIYKEFSIVEEPLRSTVTLELEEI